MITKRKMDSRLVISHFMNENMELLYELDDPKYESHFVGEADKTVCYINELMRQICSDLSKNNMRSAFRKAILLNRMLRKIRNTGDE